MNKLHSFTGVMALLIIVTFWIATVVVEILGDFEMISTVKQFILWGMIVLIPALMVAGASGFRLSVKRGGRLVESKKKRMQVIAINGLFVLLPSAIFLASRAVNGDFDVWFYSIQALELVVGAINVTLLGKNMRDGLKINGRLSSR